MTPKHLKSPKKIHKGLFNEKKVELRPVCAARLLHQIRYGRNVAASPGSLMFLYFTEVLGKSFRGKLDILRTLRAEIWFCVLRPCFATYF